MPTRTRAGQLWLTLLTVGTVLSLFGAVLGIIRYGELEAQREDDRIEFDRGSCERGNAFRADVKNLALGAAQLDRDIIDELVINPETQMKIDERLEPSYKRFQALVDEIKFNDCEKLLKPSRAFGVPSVEALATD